MRLLALVCLLVLTAGCGGQAGGPAPGAVPQEFAGACGKPGSTVTTALSRVVIRHEDCDLTGVVISNQVAGAEVPRRGESVVGVADQAGGASAGGGTIGIEVDRASGDVTFTSEP